MIKPIAKSFGAVCILALLLISCTSYTKLAPSALDDLKAQFFDLLDKKAAQQNNSAYLVQVKIKTSDFKKKFKLEIYSQGDSLSFYSPGFLGKGSFKGVIIGDSLRFYLPGDKAYYSGLWYDLTEPDLSYWREVFALMINLFSGDIIPPESDEQTQQNFKMSIKTKYDFLNGRTGNWNWYYIFEKYKLTRIVYGWTRDLLGINFRVKSYSDEFPYFQFERADIDYNNSLQRAQNKGLKPFDSEIRLDFINQKYNLEIPAEKFELHIPANAQGIEGLSLE